MFLLGADIFGDNNGRDYRRTFGRLHSGRIISSTCIVRVTARPVRVLDCIAV